eukprot:CAMPEP_0198140830 /NCGR_PEP_ID=MMETSP1443-20131203/3922_1 /TAXON_ID=186043 /ORGANISM="Entomoneis sp., Strain CCMP2396" /LENGTH=68 /DNA_ID=CAMNT_0043803365 /DNA_START=162 /DNA_END=368 /DNA_ORIENTATION=+
MGGKYDDYDWDELPEEIKTAAGLLGYRKRIWDNDKTPAAADEDWVDLTEEQQAAAAVLGYDEKMWDSS